MRITIGAIPRISYVGSIKWKNEDPVSKNIKQSPRHNGDGCQRRVVVVSKKCCQHLS